MSQSASPLAHNNYYIIMLIERPEDTSVILHYFCRSGDSTNVGEAIVREAVFSFGMHFAPNNGN